MLQPLRMLLLVCLPVLAATAGPVDGAEEAQTLEIGAAALAFDLPGIDGRSHRLDDFADAKVLVVLFTCNHCPTAQAYEQRIKQLHADFAPRGVALVAISPNDARAVRLDELGYTDLGDSLEEMKQRAKDAGFEFPYLYDGETQSVSRAYGAKATPHVFVFDAQRRLRYQGRIDDSDIGTVTSHDARNAIAAVLAGQEVPVPVTRVFGCSVKWADKQADVGVAVARWEQEPVELNELDADGIRALRENETEDYQLVNLWATWCAPCVTELPQLVDLNRMFRKRHFRLVTISLDRANRRDAALETLREHHVSATNYRSAVEDQDAFAEALDPQWPGPLPYTLLIAPGGKVVYRQEGAIAMQQLRKVIADHLGRTYASRK